MRRRLLDMIQQAVVVVGRDLKILYANKAAELLSGWKAEEVLGRPITDFVAAPREWVETRRRILETGEAGSFEFTLTRRDGSTFLAAVDGSPLLSETGEITGYIAIASDITERKRAEEALRESEEKYRSLFENMTEGFALLEVIFNADGRPEDLRYLAVNPAHERQTGLKAEDIIGRTILELLPAAASVSLDPVLPVVAGEPLRLEQRFQPLERWFEISVFKVDERHIAAVFQDITDRKQAEEALRESEEKFSSLYMSMVEGVAVYEMTYDGTRATDALILDVNPAYERLMGMTRDLVVGRRSSEAYAAKPNVDVFRMWRRVVSSGEPESIEAYWPVTGKFLSVTAFPLGGNRFANVFHDITEQKRAEEALRESEERYRALFETMTQAFALLEVVSDEDGNPSDLRILAVNPAIERQTGIRADEITGRTMGELFPGFEPIRFDRSLKVLETGVPAQFEEVVGPLGRWFEISAFKVDGRRFGATLWDITERKRMEAALRESEERLRRAVRSGRIGLFEWNVSRNTQFWSQETYELFGEEAASPANYEQWFRRVHPDDRGAVEAELAKLLERASAGERDVSHLYRHRVVHDDGTVRWLESRTTIDLEGGDIVMRGALRDISEQEQAEQAITESRAKLQTLLELLPVGVSVLDGERNVIFSNPALSRIIHLDPDGLAEGRHQKRTYLRPDGSDLPLDEVASAQAAKKGQPVENIESGVKLENGETVWVSVSASPLPFDDWRMAVITQDVTERRHREESLREHADLLEYAPVLVRNLNDEIMLWNSGMQDMYGYSREEALGRIGLELLQSEYPQPIEEVRGALFRDGRWEGEIQRTRKDGTLITVLTLQKIHRDTSGQPVAIIEVDTDITGRKLAEEQLERLRSEFYGVISHELKTPLTVIKGTAAVGLSRRTSHDPDETAELFDMISDQSDRLAEMINNLLDMTRIEAGTFSVEAHQTDLADIVTDAVRSFQRAGYRHRIEMKLNRRLPRIEADKRRVAQVLGNLLNNAAKFSPSDQPIAIRARKKGDWVVVSVRDRGMGVAADKIPLLFKKYSQLSETGRGGTGLGLWISASIIEALGGRIWAESAGLKKGATFSFTLPKLGAAEAQESVPVASGSLSILAVDDEPSILAFVERFLTVSGHRVVTTTDPFQVRGLVETEEPDVLVLDMRMPGLSGIEVLKEIRKFSEVPVVIITATDNEQQVAKARSFKGVTWLPKPFAPDELLDHVTAAGERSRRSRTLS